MGRLLDHINGALILLLVLVFCGFAMPGDLYVVSSGEKSASALVQTGPAFFFGVAITTDGSNSVTMAIYDNTEGSGDKICPDLVAPASATNRVYTFEANPPVGANEGIYVDVTCAGTYDYVVYFRSQ